MMAIPAIWSKACYSSKSLQLSAPVSGVERSGSNHLNKIVPRQFIEQLSKLSFEDQLASFIDCVLVWLLKPDFRRWLRWPGMVQPLPNRGLVADHDPFFIFDTVCFAWAKYPSDDITRSFLPLTPTNSEQAQKLIPAFCSRSFLTTLSTDFSLRRRIE